MPDLPPNIKEFNEITAVMFTQLYTSFPVDREVVLRQFSAAQVPAEAGDSR